MGAPFDIFEGTNCPGQHWACYRSQKENELPSDKDLWQRMVDLLTPSTLDETLEALQAKKTGVHCPHLRLRQKPMDKREWLVDGQIHNGAHFPLCVFTNNARARSAERAAERARRKGHGAKGKSMRSATGIGKSKHENTPPSQDPWGQPIGPPPPPPPQSRHNWQQSSDTWPQPWSSWGNSWDGRWWSCNARTGWEDNWHGR